MKKISLITALLLSIAFATNAQEVTKDHEQTTKKTETYGSILWGLYTWGEKPAKKEVATAKAKKSHGTIDIKLSENDSTAVKSILWGAVKWAEDKPTQTNEL